jgi:hypothetical protein
VHDPQYLFRLISGSSQNIDGPDNAWAIVVNCGYSNKVIAPLRSLDGATR